MGAFVLGVLVGWLAEWLFFTFFVKQKGTEDCSELRTSLNAKNSEINALKSQLDKATKKGADKKSVVGAKAESTSKTASSSVAAKSAASSNKKAAAKKTTAKKAPAKKTAKAKATPAKKPTVSKTKTKKATPRKITAKKTTAKNKTGGDDLTKLSGIGPSMAGTLKELGIDSYKKLADTNDDILRDMLEASGARLNNNKEAMDSWNEQAELADKGDFAGLKKLQETLKS